MHKIHVDHPRMLKGFSDGIGSDLMEGHTVGAVLIQAKLIRQMPRDRLTFTVGVGCQIHFRCFFGLPAQILDNILFIFGDLIDRFEPISDIYTETVLSFNSQITDMTFT